MKPHRKNGFSFIEILTVMTIIGILANIGIPAARHAKKKAVAASTLADVQVVRTALLDHYADTQTIPANADWVVVPPTIVNSLPNGFSFTRGAVDYRWQEYGAVDQGGGGELGVLRIRVSGDDTELLASIRSLFNGRAVGSGQTLTMIIE